jgi:hypothetical protein
MDALGNIIVAALATWQLVDVIHHAKIAYPIRQWALAAADSGGRWAFVGKMISCPYCLAHWVALAFVLALASPLSPVLKLVAMALAVTRLANIGNDLLKQIDLTPKADDEPDVIPLSSATST